MVWIRLRRYQRFGVALLVLALAMGAIALMLGLAFTSDRSAAMEFLGNPHAAAVDPTMAPLDGAPVRGESAVSVGSSARESGMTYTFDDVRMPDVALSAAAVSVVQCALKNKALQRDPDLDALAIAIWRADRRHALDAELMPLILERNLAVVSIVPALTADGAHADDPCQFGGTDLRTVLSPGAWAGVTTIGLAFFPEPETAYGPSSTLVIIGKRANDGGGS